VLESLVQMRRDWLGQGRRPIGLLAACFYLAINKISKEISLKKISEIFQISEETIRKRVSEFKESNNEIKAL
jgi:transcription initiation factor TFIIIB Brf1 subunit/transcription initiation factor TFIIB